MNTILFTPQYFELLLKLVAAAQIAVAILNLFLPKIMKWQPDMAAMSSLVRDVFIIHGWFISITLTIFGVLTWRFAPEMASQPSELARWFCGGIATFWGIRAVLQWTHYSSAHWRGNALRTFLHWLLFLTYTGWALVYFKTALG